MQIEKDGHPCIRLHTEGLPDVGQLLLDGGSEPSRTKKDGSGRTPLFYATNLCVKTLIRQAKMG